MMSNRVPFWHLEKILYDWATKFRALEFFMFFWFFHSLSLFLHRTNSIDECENFMQPNLTKIPQIETIFDPLNALKWLFLVMFQKICTFIRKINQTLPFVVKQGASVCTEEIPHNPTTKFRARGFFWFFFLSHSVSFYWILTFHELWTTCFIRCQFLNSPHWLIIHVFHNS